MAPETTLPETFWYTDGSNIYKHKLQEINYNVCLTCTQQQNTNILKFDILHKKRYQYITLKPLLKS